MSYEHVPDPRFYEYDEKYLAWCCCKKAHVRTLTPIVTVMLIFAALFNLSLSVIRGNTNRAIGIAVHLIIIMFLVLALFSGTACLILVFMAWTLFGLIMSSILSIVAIGAAFFSKEENLEFYINFFERMELSSLPEKMTPRKYFYLIGISFMIASLIQFWLLSLSRKTYKYLKDSQAAAKIPEVIMIQM